MNRRRPEFQAIDLATWPTVAYTEFDHEARRTFEARMQALVRYARGESLEQIEQCTGVDRRQLYRWLERALSPHPDGRPFGFRALVSYLRVTGYVRLSPVRVHGERGSCGAAGALSQLFERYPTLAAWLLLQANRASRIRAGRVIVRVAKVMDAIRAR